MPRTSSAKFAPDEGPAWSIPSLREPRFSQSLERGLAILGCFTPERPVLGIADIADELGMSRSTTHRYVITLVALGYLERRPYLQELRQRTSYTSSVGILDGPDVLFVDLAHTFRRDKHEVERTVKPGSRLPAYCTSVGKLLLANLPDQEQRELIAEIKPTKRGPNTITAKRALRDELDQVREAGFAVADEELAPQLYSISAPIRNDTRDVVAGVTLVAHSAMISLEDMVDGLGPHLVSSADHISARLGYRRNDEQNH